jgi:hypothetical protein
LSFDVTTNDIYNAFKPLGFKVQIDSQIDDEDYLRITHPDHEGIVIEASVLNNDKQFDQVSRNVECGVEKSLSDQLSEEDFKTLTDAENNHLYHIDFGEDIDHDALNSMEEFVALVQEKIVPVTTL